MPLAITQPGVSFFLGAIGCDPVNVDRHSGTPIVICVRQNFNSAMLAQFGPADWAGVKISILEEPSKMAAPAVSLWQRIPASLRDAILFLVDGSGGCLHRLERA